MSHNELIDCGANYILAILLQEISMSELGKESRTYKESLIKHPELNEFQAPTIDWSHYGKEDNSNDGIELLTNYKHLVGNN